MSNDQIIRSSKPHEVTIPEGSNNARSIRNKVGQRDIEQEHQEKVTVDKHYTDSTVQAESPAITDHQVELEQAPGSGSERVSLGQEGPTESGRIKIDDTDSSADHRVAIETTQDTTHRVTLDTDTAEGANRVKLPASEQGNNLAALPPEEGRSDDRVPIASDARDDHREPLPLESRADNRATFATEGETDHRAELDAQAASDARVPIDTQNPAAHHATLQDDARDSRSQVIEGATSSQPVSIPSDSIQDSFATTPAMTHSESTPVKIEGHGITDPDRVLVEESPPDPLAEVLVPHASQAADVTENLQEPAPAPVAAVAQAAPGATPSRAAPPQVTSHLADKKAEEFRGRVVKLRDEVDKLNHRLDEIKK